MAFSARFSLIAIIDGKDMGRNLLRNADFHTMENISDGAGNDLFHVNDGGTLSVLTSAYKGSNVGYINNTVSDNNEQYYGYFFTASIEPGKTYTVSAWAKSSSLKDGGVLELIARNKTGRLANVFYEDVSGIASSEWKKYQYTFTIPKGATEVKFLEVNFWLCEVGELYICQPKLEEGDSATDFCLNEADLKGDAPYILRTSADSIVWNQEGEVTTNEDGTVADNTKWPEKTIEAYIERDGKIVDGEIQSSVSSGSYSVSRSYDANTKKYTFTLTAPQKENDTNGKAKAELWTNGMLRLSVDSQNLQKDIPIALNALGTWKMSVINDTMTATSKKTEAYTDDKVTELQSQIKQSATDVSASVTEDIEGKLNKTGIDIENGNIDISTRTLNILGTDGRKYIFINVDDNGYPHLVFINPNTGEPAYDLGYTGLTQLVTYSQKAYFDDLPVEPLLLHAGSTVKGEDLWNGYDKKQINAFIPNNSLYIFHAAKTKGSDGKIIYPTPNGAVIDNNVYVSDNMNDNQEPSNPDAYIAQDGIYISSHYTTDKNNSSLRTYPVYFVQNDKIVNTSDYNKIAVEQLEVLDKNNKVVSYFYNIGYSGHDLADILTIVQPST